MGDSKEIEKLKRELAMQESTIKKQHQEKSDLQAQIDQLTRTVTETKQKLSKAVTDAEVCLESAMGVLVRCMKVF